jgi:protein farnesyltransferase subunit beta
MLLPYLKLGLERPLSPAPELNLRTLRRWLVQMQGNERELGGFKGRTNKLVDGCYSWWVGGAFALLTAVEGSHHDSDSTMSDNANSGASENEDWSDVDGELLFT